MAPSHRAGLIGALHDQEVVTPHRRVSRLRFADGCRTDNTTAKRVHADGAGCAAAWLMRTSVGQVCHPAGIAGVPPHEPT